jgi:hypothetical protein
MIRQNLSHFPGSRGRLNRGVARLGALEGEGVVGRFPNSVNAYRVCHVVDEAD